MKKLINLSIIASSLFLAISASASISCQEMSSKDTKLLCKQNKRIMKLLQKVHGVDDTELNEDGLPKTYCECETYREYDSDNIIGPTMMYGYKMYNKGKIVKDSGAVSYGEHMAKNDCEEQIRKTPACF